MGVTISCKKGQKSLDVGCGGFLRLRMRIAELVGEPLFSHYKECCSPVESGLYHMDKEQREEYWKSYDARTMDLINNGKVNIKIADFLYQGDTGGSIRYGACKLLLKVIGDYDDDYLYGYVGRPDCVKFKDFKQLLEECVNLKCDMVWW